MTQSRFIVFSRSLILAGLLVLPITVMAAPTVQAPVTTPTFVTVGQSTSLTVTAYVKGDATNPVIATGVSLLRLDATGKVLATLGRMWDDGTNGDAVAGDGFFTLNVTANEPVVGDIRLQVSAAFVKLLSRVKSNVTLVPVFEKNSVDSTGGSATSDDSNLNIRVPAGAVAASTTITITSSGDNAGQIGTLYEVTGQGKTDLTFLQPVTIKLSYELGAVPLGNIEADLKIGLLGPFDSWEILTDSAVDTVNKVVIATTTHFSKVGILSASNIKNAALKLSFPLPKRSPFTAVINSVFDHSMVAPYCQDDKVQTYTGDIGITNPTACLSFPKNKSTCGNNKTTQILCNYGTGGEPVAYVNGNADTTVISYDGHPGYDYRTTDQTSVDGIAGHIEVLAAAGGKAHVVGNWTWGTVWIDHDNGFTTHYLHLDKASIIEGQVVKQGDPIGVAGNTAPFYVGPHLHFEVRKDNIPIDPYALNLWSETSAGRLNDTGITSSQCYQAGSDTLVACNSAGAIALNNAQDGMTGRDANAATNSNTDGKLGFSFSAVPGGCVQDKVTGLMWEVKTTDGGLRDWNKTYTNYSATYNPSNLYGTSTDASGFVTAVNASNLCGYSDWRLPAVDELQSIVDYGVAYPGPTVDATWFPNTQGSVFWSAPPSVGYSVNAWVVNFYDGYVGYYSYVGIDARDVTRYVRLVRAGNQVQNRYTVSADGQEVTDSQTNLIWRRCAEGMVFSGGTCTGNASGFTHEAALQRAATQAGSTGIAWRLPNIKELSSIADKSRSYPAIDPSAFPATQLPSLFWSVSPYVGLSGDAWFIYFGNGVVSNVPRNYYSVYNPFYVRLVRDGQ